jgi:hypothetical protein
MTSRLAAEGADRHAAADDLAERGEVGAHAGELLHAAARHPEAGHDLVEDQQGAVAVAGRAQALQEAGDRADHVHVAGDRLDDDAGDFLAELLEGLFDLFEVVVGERDGVLGQRRRHARRSRHAQGQRTGAGLHQQRVGVAVVTALELDDLVAAREAARQTDGTHGRLRPRADEAHQLDGGHDLADPPGQLGLDGRGRAERQPVERGGPHRLDDRRVGVAEDHRAPGAHVIDVLPAVFPPDAGAGGLADEHRLAADGTERADRRVDAAGDVTLGLLEQVHGGKPPG